MDPGKDLEFGPGILEFGAQLLSIQGPGKAMDSLKILFMSHAHRPCGKRFWAKSNGKSNDTTFVCRIILYSLSFFLTTP